MGLFSWKTQDTDRSIPCDGSSRPTFHVTMTDNKGNIWHEPNYQGYGEFGGKDYYQLMAEMNKPKQCTGDVDKDREIGINLTYGICAIRHKVSGNIFKGRGNDFFNWETDILPNGLSANGCLETGEWDRLDIKESPLLYPNLTERKKRLWINEEPENCEFQGYFYYSDDEDDDEEY